MLLLLLVVFVIGYVAIIFEKEIKINKSAVSLVMGSICWMIYLKHVGHVDEHWLMGQIGDILQIVIFLMAATSIVEIIEEHRGFSIITNKLKRASGVVLFFGITFVAFFMSALLDNLTALVIVVSFLRKLFTNKEKRWIYGSLAVISVNAGGAWSPIGDVTTTMLWMKDYISAVNTVKCLIIPSLVNVTISTICAFLFLRKTASNKDLKVNEEPNYEMEKVRGGGTLVFWCGAGSLLGIPVLKVVFGLHPCLGALFALGFVWIVTDLLHKKDETENLKMPTAIKKIDFATPLFFAGILFSLSAIDAAGFLIKLSNLIQETFSNNYLIAVVLGFVSAIFDNVPLVAAAINMYDFPRDHTMWQLIAYCAGTGGSLLIIGSAAGVALMGLEKVDFLWYMKRISLIALIGYISGLVCYFLMFL